MRVQSVTSMLTLSIANIIEVQLRTDKAAVSTEGSNEGSNLSSACRNQVVSAWHRYYTATYEASASHLDKVNYVRSSPVLLAVPKLLHLHQSYSKWKRPSQFNN
jgi:hypothetical protein